MTTPSKPREFFSDEGVDLIARGIFPDEMDQAAQALAKCLQQERAKNAELEDVNRKLADDVSGIEYHKIERYRKLLNASEEKNSKLVEALITYGRHNPVNCYWLESEDRWECKCGLNRMLEAFAENGEQNG